VGEEEGGEGGVGWEKRISLSARPGTLYKDVRGLQLFFVEV